VADFRRHLGPAMPARPVDTIIERLITMSSDPIIQAFDHLVRRRGQEPLVASPSRRASIHDVDGLARGLDSVLGAAGPISPGTPVAFAVCDGVAFLASFVATRRRGVVPVLLDWRAPSPERDRIVRDLGCEWILSCDTQWPEGAGDWQLRRVPKEVEPPPLAPDVAAVKLSSGSTGKPRGIVTSAEALAADDAGLAKTMGLRADERILASVPLSHSYGLASIAMPALVRGSLIVLADEGSGPFGNLHAARVLEATFLPTVPAFLGALVRTDRPHGLAPSLRLVVSAGAQLPAETAARFRAVYGLPIQVFYGSSETGGICFDREGGAGERGSVGEPVEGVHIELDRVEGTGCHESGDDEAAPTVGMVTVESAAVARGYWPEAHPKLARGRFASSDLARWESGELVLLGRTDDLINIRGKKVNPREVEEALAALPGVREVVALGAVDCAQRGEMALRVVVAGELARLTHAVVVDWCRSRLAEHKVPRSVVLVDEIPRTARGKIDRQALEHLAANRGRRRGEPSGVR